MESGTTTEIDQKESILVFLTNKKSYLILKNTFIGVIIGLKTMHVTLLSVLIGLHPLI